MSVVITTYNHAQFLPDAIESVLAQTAQDFELIVIDDGSTDDAAGVVARYPRCRYFRQSNQGLSAARNAGLRESVGTFVIFLDADDRLLPGAIDAGLRCHRTNADSAFVFGKYRMIDVDGKAQPGSQKAAQTADPYEALLLGNYVGMHATVIYRRSVFDVVGGFNSKLRACEDYDIYLRISKLFSVATHSEPVAEYRMHGDNMSGNLGLMLVSVVRILKAQRAAMADSPLRLAAVNSGLESWKFYFSERLLDRLPGMCSSVKTALKIPRLLGPFLVHAPATVATSATWRWRAIRQDLVKRFLPFQVRRWLRRARRLPPLPTPVAFGDLRRLTPVSRHFGYDRGLPVDRHYIERFLANESDIIRGRVLEVGGREYTIRFGGERVQKSDVLHVDASNADATFVDDLAKGDTLPSDTFDCVILTQTLQFIYEVRAAIATLHRILKPGGVLLMTVPGTISQIEQGTWADAWHWGFTTLSIRKLCEERFAANRLDVQAYGNVLASISFLEGIAAEELRAAELDFRDSLYPLLITVRAEKPA